MASRTKRGNTNETGDSGDDWKRFAAAGGLLLLVLVILVLGGLLQRGPEDPSDPAGSSTVTIERSATEGVPAVPANAPPEVPVEAVRPAEPVADPVPPAPAPAATASPKPATELPADPAARARTDVRRIGRGDGWTLQLLVACDPDNAARRIADAGPAEQLYVLPRLLDGRSCFRLCWGRYPDRETALAARDLPGDLRRSLDEAPQPRRIADVLP